VPKPVVIIVTGAPCTGKTELARRVAERFSLPAVNKDMLKELLFDALGWKDREWSKRLGHASIELLFQFLEIQLVARQSCIVESNFYVEFHTSRFLELAERYEFKPVQILCIAQGDVLLERFKRRSASGERHVGHGDHLNLGEFQEMLLRGRWPTLDIGGHIIKVDTTDFDSVDYAALFQEIAECLMAGKEDRA
jgi:cytidylate kinase